MEKNQKREEKGMLIQGERDQKTEEAKETRGLKEK